MITIAGYPFPSQYLFFYFLSVEFWATGKPQYGALTITAQG